MGDRTLQIILVVASPIISFLLGLVSIGLVWLIRTTNKNHNDLNAAFKKIRDIEDELYGDNP